MADEFRGKIGAMDSEEVAAFLGSDALARLACVKPDGSPYVVPVWFHWDGSDFWFVGRQQAEWCRHLKNDPRICIVIDAPHSPADEMGKSTEVPKVFAEGTAEVVEAPNVGGQWVEIAEKMSFQVPGPQRPHVPDRKQAAAEVAVPDAADQDQDVAGRRLGAQILGGHHRRTELRGHPFVAGTVGPRTRSL